ncbi:transporter substrate-binding domain-containing protein [Phyllobacterium meliloti]|uniref:transporter substrate-binding domain-containing protein n=1 Tax=Phyllobacterium meliloti TaxID=555317 RepID=UPI001D151795|nr:transporter substrate-binding domain-containing protein [Phyllobacterium sp. T1293]UGX86301.1 transporter substrate-binding domain-containing protein [Phyllobacterium sp. T1293]
MGISKSLRVMIAAVGVAAAGLFSAVDANAVTLNDITSRGTVRIGVLTGAPPMGMVDEKGNPTGYDVDVANLIAGYLGVKAELVPLTPPSRIPALQTGKVDFLVATLAPTGERAKTVMFTQPYSAFNMVIVSGKDQKFGALSELSGKRVAVNRGSSQEAALRKVAVPGLELVVYEDDSTTAQALIAGQVDAVALPSTVADAVLKQLPDAGLQVGFTFFRQGNSMATTLQDFEMRQWLNTAIYLMKNSGELDAISVKWTGQPMPQLPSF